jgi:hypothetical protein
MRIFIPAVERPLRVIAALALLGAIVFPFGWGYAQRRQARAWQETACAYRLGDVARRTNSLLSVDERDNACAVLHRLGLDLDTTP